MHRDPPILLYVEFTFSCHFMHLLHDKNKFHRTRRAEDEGSSRRPSPTRKRRPSTYKKRPADLDRYTCDMALNIVARKVEVAKANNGGVLKYKAMTDIVNSMKPTLPWLTKGMLRNHVNKLNKEKMKRDTARPPDEDVAGATANNGGESTSTLSALTLDTGGNSTQHYGSY